MLVFFSIALVGFLYVVLGSVLGHAHDAAADVIHGDFGHDGGDHESDHSIISMFSPRVLATFLMGFGAAGGVARFYNISYILSSLIAIGVGCLVGYLIFLLLEFFQKQQANSVISTKTLIGQTGVVEVGIDAGRAGQVAVSYAGRSQVYLASSQNGEAIQKGYRVRVVETVGSNLVVVPA